MEQQQAEIEEMENKVLINKKINELEHAALLAQMNPHFIFNSLNTLQELVIKKNETETLNFISNFSSLLRELLENSLRQKITLKQEIAFITKYVHLEEVRFANNFNFDIVMDESIPAHLIQIPVMLVQPLIENAIRHGLAPLKAKQKLLLKMIIEIENGFLYLQVKDNGKGFVEDPVPEFRYPSVALKNIQLKPLKESLVVLNLSVLILGQKKEQFQNYGFHCN
jgi:LytS/YehU family sensor histidine kinase